LAAFCRRRRRNPHLFECSSADQSPFWATIGAPRKFAGMSTPECIEASYLSSELQYWSSQTLATRHFERLNLHEEQRD
jgi:hypothetical protein